MKGQSHVPFFFIEAAFTALILLGVAIGTQSYTTDYVKKETVDLQAERIGNAAFSLNSVPEGFVEIPAQEYEIKQQAENISVKYSDSAANYTLEDVDVTSFDGPDEYNETEGYICVNKTSQTSIAFVPEAC